MYRVTLFGESHGLVAGALVTGCPAGVPFDQAFLQHQLDRRRPGQSLVTTQRKEGDQLELLAGVYKGRTTGAPLCMLVRNGDADSSAYPPDRPRPGHADLAGRYKFFGFEDPRGAGHFGGRLTVGLVAAGALARLALRRAGVEVLAYTEEIGGIRMEKELAWQDAADAVDSSAVRCPEAAAAAQMEELILSTRKQGDSVGGIVRCRIRGMPPGVGAYHFESFESQMGQLLFGIPAVKGVEFGQGFSLARSRGSDANDAIGLVEGRARTLTRKQGGVVGGITDGNEVELRVAFKPTSSLPRAQRTVDLATMEPVELITRGRHDPCIVPRAVPVVENAAAVVVLDLLLRRLGEQAFQALDR